MSYHCKDVDEFLKNSDNPEADFRQLLDKAKPAHAPSAECDLQQGDYSFSSFEILGELPDTSIAIHSKINQKTYKVSIKDLTLDKLIQIGGEEVMNRVTRKYKEGKIPFDLLKRHLIVEAAKKQLPDLEWLGEGIHLLRNDHLLIQNGREACIYTGEKFVSHEHPLVEDRLIDWRPGSEWIRLKDLIPRVMAMTPGKGKQITDKLLAILYQWGLKAKAHHLLCGFLLAQMVQACWEWRPHAWLAGSQGSGKTLLTIMVEALGGKLAMRLEGQNLTEPGLRQSIKNSSTLITIDEFEKSPQREPIIEFLRSAGRGGLVIKGSVHQKAEKYRVRHMVLLCSIETSQRRAAEHSRFITFETKKDFNRDPQIPDAATMEDLRLDCFSFAIWASARAKKLIRQIHYIKGVDRRFLQSIAVPFSMLAVCDDDPVVKLNFFLDEYINGWAAVQDGSILEDEIRLIEDIFTSLIRIPIKETNAETGFESTIYADRTVSQIIAETEISNEADETLQAHGIKFRQKDSTIFLHPDMIRRRLLRDTPWHGLNIRDILMRLPGAVAWRERLAGTKQKNGVLIPYSEETNE